MKTRLLAFVCLISILAIVTISGPALSQTILFTETFSSTTYSDIPATTAWWDVASGELKLHPFEMTSLGTYDTPNRMSFGAVLAGNILYLADNNVAGSMVYAFDVSNPTSPSIRGSLFVTGEARDLDVSGNYVYLANYAEGLSVIDVSDPASPAFAGNYNTSGEANDVKVRGNYAYVADGPAGLKIIDITDPTSPTLAGSYATPGTAMRLVVDGDYAYIASYEAGVSIVDISDKTTPVMAGTYSDLGSVEYVDVWGNQLYAADQASGLVILDVTDPSNPVRRSQYDCGFGYCVSVDGDYAYVGVYDAGYKVKLIDVSDPESDARGAVEATQFTSGETSPR